MASVRFQGELIPIPPGGTILLGRHSECQVRIIHDEASRRHARIVAGSGEITIEDLGSLNGTWVNGDRTTGRHVLHDGDRITVCGFAVEFIDPPASPAAPTIAKGHPGIASTAPAAASTAQVTMTTQGPQSAPPAAPPPLAAPSPSPPALAGPEASAKRRAREADTIKMPGEMGTTTEIRKVNKSMKLAIVILIALVAGLAIGLFTVLLLLKQGNGKAPETDAQEVPAAPASSEPSPSEPKPQ